MGRKGADRERDKYIERKGERVRRKEGKGSKKGKGEGGGAKSDKNVAWGMSCPCSTSPSPFSLGTTSHFVSFVA